jgi:hypothetical protein
MGEMGNAYKMLLGKTEGKRHLTERSIILKWYAGVDWVLRLRRMGAVMKVVTKLQIPQKGGVGASLPKSCAL